MNTPMLSVCPENNGNGRTLCSTLKALGVEEKLIFLEGNNGFKHLAYHPEITLRHRQHAHDRFWQLGHVTGKGNTREEAEKDFLKNVCNPLRAMFYMLGPNDPHDFDQDPSNFQLAIGPIGRPRNYAQITHAPQAG